MWRGIVVCAALLLALAARPAVAARQDTDPDHRVLVMLAMAPDHFRAGSGYGGGYGDLADRTARMRTARRIARAHKLRVVDDWPMPLLAIDCFVMAIPDARTPDQVAAELAGEKAISWSQPLRLFHGQGTVSGSVDPMLAAQPAEKYWRLDRLHHIATGKGVSIAVIDSGIDRAHPDLKGQVRIARDFVGTGAPIAERHGTGVAGVIAARSDDGIGIAGVAPAATLIGLRACRDTGGPAAGAATVCDSLSLAKALQFALEHHAAIINLSLTGPQDLLLARLIAIALTNGVSVVAAVDPARRDGGFPASIAGVIAVAAQPVAEAATGPYGAPGRDIPTTGPGGKWLIVDGNSFAAAHVSGLIALARERSPHRNPGITRAAGGMIDACRTVACQPSAGDSRCAESCAAP
jgi:subtilisin family serine protease